MQHLCHPCSNNLNVHLKKKVLLKLRFLVTKSKTRKFMLEDGYVHQGLFQA